MLKICTFNIQNDFKNYNIEKTNKIIEILKKYKVDIYNLQEVYSKVDKDLSKSISKLEYNINGKYRFFLKKILNKVNESNPIITNKKVIRTKTYYLPFLPSLLKRVITKVEIIDKNNVISVYNTHLDFKYDFVKKRQLKRIIKLLRKDNNLIILTGDFNLKTNNKIFRDFIDELKGINIKHINIGDKTLKDSKYHKAIDHIFISDKFKLKEKIRLTDVDISDHYPVLIKIDYK